MKYFFTDLFALMPPFETFLNVDKTARLRHFFDVSKIFLYRFYFIEKDL